MERPDLLVWFLVVLQIALTAWVFLPTVSFPLVEWDDPEYIQRNTALDALSPEQVNKQFRSYVMGNYHPITMLSYSLDITLGGGVDARTMHRTNVVLHLVNGIAVLLFLWLLTGQPRLASMAALLFAVSPLRVETVAWISDRKDLLMLFFGMAMFSCYILYLRRQTRWWLLPSFVFFLLACLSKGMAVGFAPTLVIIDQFLGRSIRERSLWLIKVPFFLTALLFGIIAIKAQASTEALEGAADVSLGMRFMLATANIAWYAAQTIVPLGLSPRYGYPDIRYALPLEYLLAVGVALLLAWLVFKYRRHPMVLFCALFFFLNIALVLQALQVGSAIRADRYLYVAGIGPVLLLAWGSMELAERWTKRATWALFLIIPYVLWTAVAARSYTGIWSTSNSIWHRMVESSPKDPLMLIGRAKLHRLQGEYEQGIADLDKAIRMNPKLILAYYDRGALKAEAGKHDAAMQDYLKVYTSKIQPPPLLLQSMFISLMKLGRYEEAANNCTTALRMGQSSPVLYNIRGYSRLRLGQLDSARADLERSRAMDPGLADSRFIQSQIILAMGDTTTACDTLQRIDPEQLVDRDKRNELAVLKATFCSP